MKRHFKKARIVCIPLFALAASAPALAADFGSVSVTDIASDNGVNSIQYVLRYALGQGSDGLAPGTESTLISNEPDPNNPFAAQMPSLQVSIPPGCWGDTGKGVSFQISGTGCGVQVNLVQTGSAPVSVTGHVVGFTALIVNRASGLLKATVTFDSGFDALADSNPGGVLSFSVGNDSISGVPLDGRVATRSN